MAEPKAAAAKRARETAGKGSGLWLQGAAFGASLTFAAPTMVMLGVLLAPGIACRVTEMEGGRGMTRAVALACLAGAIRPAWQLWLNGERMEVAVDRLCDPLVLLACWGAGACSWALCQVVPVLVRGAWDAREGARAARLEAEIARLRGEWDLENV
jgi:hypothetical protein